MNKSFKVVFSKARSALMVVNEATSSIQAKGTKTVIAAAAAAMIAGGAVAATTSIVTDGSKLVNGTAYDSYTSAKGDDFGALSVRDTSGSAVNLSFTNNTSSGKAGALALDRASLTLTDAQFSNNSADGFGGAVRLWGTSASRSALELKTTRDLTYAGNKAGQGKTAVSGATALGARYEDMGGFAHLQGNSTLTLTADANTTLTIGETGAAQTAGLDSITTTGSNNNLVINGKGTVNLNGSLESFVGEITVSGGTVNMATGFGSIDTTTQSRVNKLKDNESDAEAGPVQSVLTVQSGATVNMGALTINRDTTANKVKQAGTKLAVADGGKLYVESITLGTKEYKDKYLATSDEKLASGSLTTTGYGVVDVASGAVAEVKKDVTVAAGTTFDKTGSGAFTVLGTLKTEAAVKDGAPAGIFNVNGGSVAVNTVANAGTTNVSGSTGGASGAIFSVTGTGSTNSGDISLQSGAAFVVKAGADLTNTGAIAGAKDQSGAYTSVGDVEVAGKLVNGGKGLIQTATLTVEDGGYVSTKITDAYAVGKTTVKKGGTFNLTELNSHLDGTAEGAFDQLLLAGGEVELAGGAVTVADKAFTGNVQLGVNILNEQKNPTSYSAATLTISAGEYAADTFTTLPNRFGQQKVKSTLNVTGGQYTIKTLNANGGVINVEGTGKLVIDTKLSTNSDSAFEIKKGGTVETTAAALGLKIGATGVTVDSGSTYKKTITNNGELVLSDLTGITTTKTYLAGIKTAIHGNSTGLLNLGALTISDAVTDGKVTFNDVQEALAGIASDALSQATVTGVDGAFTNPGSYGKLETTIDGPVTVSAALTLNGTGDLVTFVSGSTTAVKGITLASGGSLTTTGSANGGAKIGAVLKDTANNASGTSLTVADNGVLTVSQTDLAPNDQGIKLVNVDTLTIGKGAQLTAGITKAAGAASGQTPATPATYGDIEAGTLNVHGKLDASNSTVTVTSGATFTGDVASTVKTLSISGATTTVSVGTKTAAGKLVVGDVSGDGKIFADPAFVDGVSRSHSTVAVGTVSAGNTVVAGQNSVVAVGFKDTAAADAAFAKTGFVLADTTAENAPANAVNSVLYVQGTKDANGVHVSATGKFAATNETESTSYSGQGVQINAGSLLVVDASTVDATYGNTAVFSGNVDVQKGAKVYLANVVNGNTIKLGTSGQLNGDLHFEGDLLLNEQTSGSTVTIKSADLKTLKSEFGDVAGIDAAWGMFDEGANLNNNSKSAAHGERSLFQNVTAR